MVAVVNSIVVSLGIADDAGIGDMEMPEQKPVMVEHVNGLGAVGADQRLARVTGAVVHENGRGRKELAQRQSILIGQSVHILSNQSHGFRLLNKLSRC